MSNPPFTLLAFHYYLGNYRKSHPNFEPLLMRLNSEAAVVDQGVYILRTQQDGELIDGCLEYLQTQPKPYALVRFDPRDERLLQYGTSDLQTAAKIELWILDLETEEI